MKSKFNDILFLCIIIALFFLFDSCKPEVTEAPPLETKLSGRITDKATNAAIVGALVITNPTTSSVSSDGSGSYTISNVTAGQYVVTASKDVYKSNSINVVAVEGKTNSADIQLQVLGPELATSTTSLDFGTSQTTTNFTISNNSAIGTVNWTANTTVSWITITPSSGSMTTGTSTVTVQANRVGLSYGNYTAAITITSNAGNKDVLVVLVVSNPNAPQLTVNPVSLDFGETASNLSMNIRNTGTGKLTWNVSSPQSWITLSPTNDSTRTEIDEVRIAINRSGHSPGEYSGIINVTSNAGTQSVNVTMTVPSIPALSLSTTILDFDSSKTQLSFSLSNAGAGTLNWSVSKNQSWIAIAPTSGTNTGTVNVTVSRNGLTSGTYSGIVSVTSNGGNGSVVINMMKTPPMPPSPVTIQAGTLTTNSIKILWSVYPTASDFAAYKIYYSTSPAVNESSTLAATISNRTTQDYTVTGLSSNTTYYFRVYVMNQSQVTSGSNTVSATTQMTIGTWSVVASLTDSYGKASDIAYVSDNEVWVVGSTNGQYNGKIWKYNGTQWLNITVPDSSYEFKNIAFLSSNEGYAISGYNIFKYNGIQWAKINTGISTIFYYSMKVVNSNNIWIGGNGKVVHWNGTVWSSLTISANTVEAFSLMTNNDGYLIDDWGKVFKYNGIGWSVHSTVGSTSNDISVLSANDMWLCKDYDGLYHYDGTSWTQYTDPITGYKLSSIYSVQMLSTNNGWAVGYGRIYHFDGNKWTEISSPTSSSLYRVRMTSASDGWAVGTGGVVLRYH